MNSVFVACTRVDWDGRRSEIWGTRWHTRRCTGWDTSRHAGLDAGKVEAETVEDTLREVDAEAVVDTLTDTVAKADTDVFWVLKRLSEHLPITAEKCRFDDKLSKAGRKFFLESTTKSLIW